MRESYQMIADKMEANFDLTVLEFLFLHRNTQIGVYELLPVSTLEFLLIRLSEMATGQYRHAWRIYHVPGDSLTIRKKAITTLEVLSVLMKRPA